MTTYLITRHAGAVEWLRQQDVRVDQVLTHLDNADLIAPGDTVIGVLPVNLAAEVCERGAAYMALSLSLPPEARGRELTPEDMNRFGARLERFNVKRVRYLGDLM